MPAGSAREELTVLVLGPVEVRHAGEPVRIGRPLERALAARLALARGAAVPDGRLARDLWGEAAGDRSTERLRVLASRLRRALGPHAGMLRRGPAGYALAAAPADLLAAEDALALVRGVTGVRPALSRSAVGAALGQWRGAALADLRAVPYAAAEGERLDRWRVELAVDKLAAETDLGIADLAELEHLAAEHPVHERLHGLLAVTLYRAGRQSDALALLAVLRRALAENLGVDPAPALATLELRLLRHDPALNPPPPPPAPLPLSPPAPDTPGLDTPGLHTPGLDTPGLDTPGPAAAPAGPGPTSLGLAGGVGGGPVGRAGWPLPRFPVSAGEFVGRAAELRALGAVVARGGLATVVGAPGSGKTRLAFEVARLAGDAGWPVVLVELAPLRSADAVRAALFAAAGSLAARSAEAGPAGEPAAPGGERAAVSGVRDCAVALAGALLVVDNAEHLVEEVAELVDELCAAAGPAVLVTSQRPLALPGEFVQPLGPLPAVEAARLFTVRTAAAGGDTAYGVVDRSASAPAAPNTAPGPAVPVAGSSVDTVCAAVDRLPLGIELAAGLTRSMTVPQLAARVGLRLLVGGSRAAGRRHTSLRAALNWSYELLPAAERVALRRLAVFAGGWTLEAAERVLPDAAQAAAAEPGRPVPGGAQPVNAEPGNAGQGGAGRGGAGQGGAGQGGAEPGNAGQGGAGQGGAGRGGAGQGGAGQGGAGPSGVEPGGAGLGGAGAVALALAGLVDRSLVTYAAGRYGLLETVREYAAEQLAASGDEAAARRRHLDWCRELVAAHDVQGDTGPADLAALVAEWPNLHHALELAAGTDRATGALRLANALDPAWQVRGEFRRASGHYAALVEAPGAAAAERAEAYSNYGLATALAGQVDAASRLLTRAAELAAAAGAEELAMRVLYHRGVLELQRGYPGLAVEPLTDGLALADTLRRERATSAFVDALGSAALYAGDAEGAAGLHAAACAYDRYAGYEHGLARGLVNEADAWFGAGRVDLALERVARAEAVAARLADRSAFAVAALLRGQVAAAGGDLDAAAGLLTEAVEHAAAAGSDAYATLARADLAEVLARSGEPTRAAALLEAVRAATADRGFTWLAALPAFAAAALAAGDRDGARELADQAAAEYADRSFDWPQVAARLRRVRAELAAVTAPEPHISAG